MADNGIPLASTTLVPSGARVTWQDGREAIFHSIWLRHSPGFPDSERPAGPKGRFPSAPETQLTKSSITSTGKLRLEWSSGQHSLHDAEWLRRYIYDQEALEQRRRPVVPWTPETLSKQVEFDYTDLAHNEQERLPLFEHLLDHGVVMLRNVPTKPNTLTTVANWLGHVPANLYADDISQPTISNVCFDPKVTVGTSMCHFLGPHTDTCWRQTLTGLLLLHCLKAHSNGGQSIVVDGFAVAERMREQNNELFNLLCDLPLSFGSTVGDRDYWRVQGRVISVAADGALEGIRFNSNSFEQLELPSDMIESAYQALELFESILYDRSLWWQPQLQPGDLLLVDNHRVLHGREAFDPAGGERHLQSCSVDRDDFHIRYRRLAKQQGAPGWDQRLTAGAN